MEKIPIICIHGIRRKDKWFETLKENLDNTKYEILVFENVFWSIFKLIIPYSRKKIIKQFQEFYSEINKKFKTTPYLICHSFGSYIFYQSIKKYPSIKFDKIIMVGSILNPNTKWDEHIKGNFPQMKKLLHEHGLKDKFVWATRFIEDGGNSGEVGFLNIKKHTKIDKILTQVRYDNFDHSDYFLNLHIKENWIPFITDEKLPYKPEILRDEIINRLYENIESFSKYNNNIQLESVIYSARIDTNGNYYLKYTYQGKVQNEDMDKFFFKSSADSNKSFQEEDILVIDASNNNLKKTIKTLNTFEVLIEVECNEDYNIHDEFGLTLNLCWDSAINFETGDTDHFALKDTNKASIKLNFPYKLKKPYFFMVKDNLIIDRKDPILIEEKDSTFTYSYDVKDNSSNDIDGIIFYFEKISNTQKNKNSIDCKIKDKKTITLKEDNEEILFRCCTEKDIEKIYFLEKQKIEFHNAATEDTLIKRLSLFPNGFIIAENSNKDIIGYIESIIIKDWNFKTFDEIQKFENIYNILGDTLYIIFIAVDPKYRNNAVASNLLKIILEQAEKYNVKKIKLIAKDDAIGLYKKNNFTVKDNLRNFLPNSVINASMEQIINN